MLKFRASSLAEIMTDGKSGGLSVGAKTHIQQLAKEFVYGYDKRITSKYMDKGIQVEDQSIELLNSVLFTDYKKNTERKENDWITGECDIFTGQMIYDIKSSWSLDTFPVLASQGENSTYEWQLRAYMWLWNVDKAAIAYCLSILQRSWLAMRIQRFTWSITSILSYGLRLSNMSVTSRLRKKSSLK